MNVDMVIVISRTCYYNTLTNTTITLLTLVKYVSLQAINFGFRRTLGKLIYSENKVN